MLASVVAAHNRDVDGPTPLIRRDALLGLIDRSAPAQAHVHTVPRERLRARTGDVVEVADATDVHVDVVDVAPMQRLPARATYRDLDEEIGPSVSPLLVLGVIALLIVTFIVATQLR